MKSARWRSAAIYGLALVICQPLVGCGEKGTQQSEASVNAAPVNNAAVLENAPLIVAFGDSLYAGYQLGPKEGLAPQLQAALAREGVPAKVHDAGVSGDTTAVGLQRLPFLLNNLPKKPDLFVLGLGGNDMLRGLGPEETQKNLAAMLDLLAEKKIPVVLTGMLAAPNMGRDYGAKFEAIFPALAKEKGVPLYPFLLDGVITDPSLMLQDHIHPNAKGVSKIAAALAPTVVKALPARPADQ